MKKGFKSFAIVLLLSFMFVAPILAGCSKTCIVEVAVKAGNGDVRYNKQSLVGKNAVAEGSQFRFVITPDTGYEIAEIVIDGEEYTRSYKRSGTEITLDKITKDAKIEVAFRLKTYTVTVKCSDVRGGQFYGFVDYRTYSVLHGQRLDLSAFGENVVDVFFYNKQLADGTQVRQAINTSVGILVNTDFTVYTDKTATELNSMITQNA